MMTMGPTRFLNRTHRRSHSPSLGATPEALLSGRYSISDRYPWALQQTAIADK